MIIYYAHSMLTYGSKKEKKELKRIKRLFPKCCIINPAKLAFQSFSGLGIMMECLEYVKKSDAVVATEFKGYIGKGVFTELNEATKKYLLRDKHLITDFVIRIADRNDWRIRYAKCEEASQMRMERG